MRGQAVAKRQAARPEQSSFTDPDPSTTKKETKNTVLRLLFKLLSLKTDVIYGTGTGT
jgi:hypothetical protein